MTPSGQGTRTVGRYVLCDEIAAGGMATVHIGRLIGPVGFARTVAIKRLHAHFAKDPEFVAMFLDEARLAARVRHANVVATLDVVVLSGELFVVMDYVHGESIATLIRACRATHGTGVPVPIALTLMSGALYGLHAAHEATTESGAPLRIVHRDVSPQNILVGEDGVPRVVDFGVAKAADRLQTTTAGGLKGKVAYMSPEQVMSKPVDRRTDVYAASVVLWEMLTGRRLFKADNEVALIQAVMSGDVSPPSAFVHGLPPAVDALVMRGLAKDPADRFPTAWDMAEAAQHISYATPGQVAAWVQSLSGATLDVRAARVAQIESDSAQIATHVAAHDAQDAAPDSATRVRDVQAGPVPAFGRPSPSPLAAPAPPLEPPTSQVSAFNMTTPVRRPRTPLVLAIVAPLLITFIVTAALLARGSSTDPAAPAASSAQEAPAAASTPITAPPDPTPVPSTAPAPEPPASATASAHRPAERVRRTEPRPHAAPSRAQRGCNPPYTISAQGIRVPKMECM